MSDEKTIHPENPILKAALHEVRGVLEKYDLSGFAVVTNKEDFEYINRHLLE